MLAVHRVTARTLNTACGWYTTRSTDSTDTCMVRGEAGGAWGQQPMGSRCQQRSTRRLMELAGSKVQLLDVDSTA